MRGTKYNCDGSPVIAVCAAIVGVICFITNEGYKAGNLTLLWIGVVALVIVIGYAIQHGIRFGF